ncbi:MAG: HAD-IA family hydrolase [Verrucomicrobiota bacterium]
MSASSTSHQKPLLIFDFDGTLADTLAVGVEIFNDVAGDYGLKTVSAEEVEELRKLNTRALLDRLGISRLMAVKMAARIRHLLSKRIDEVPLMPGAEKMIRDLSDAGFGMGILSSNAVDNVRRFLAHYDLENCFHFVEAGASLFGKGSRLRSILKRERREAPAVMYVGDETRDMEAARDAGIHGVAVCWGANEREAMLTEDPDFCVDAPEELVKVALAFVAAGNKTPE